ncbi:N-acetylglucosamine kinase [Cohnella sp. GCM10027633]|uniref:N-acetylglucosamine kinase n=1 Tax=unclassified Cohnella TaxID=2636738 RepID=UPI003644BB24
MPIYLGVDAGGSKTYAMVADEHGRTLGTGKSGNGNHQLDRDGAAANIRDAVLQALAEAGRSVGEVAYSFFGLSGADREADYRILHPMIKPLGLPEYRISCDTMIALRAGTYQPHGVVLICGTGTNCAGRDRKGNELQIGGFGSMYGDYGGGADIAIDAFKAVIRHWEGRGFATSLTAEMLRVYGYPDVATMFHDFLDRNLTRVPLSIVPCLFAEAAKGDLVSGSILTKQGRELGLSAQAMIRRLELEQDSFDVVLAGSVVTKGEGPFVFEPIERAVRQVAPHARVVKLQAEPVIGAILSAMDAAGAQVPAEVDRTLREVRFEKTV